jgi:hypothetical protein
MSVEKRSGVAWNAAKPHGDDHAITNVSKQHRAVISPHPDSVFVENCGRRLETSWAILLQCRQGIGIGAGAGWRSVRYKYRLRLGHLQSRHRSMHATLTAALRVQSSSWLFETCPLDAAKGEAPSCEDGASESFQSPT